MHVYGLVDYAYILHVFKARRIYIRSFLLYRLTEVGTHFSSHVICNANENIALVSFVKSRLCAGYAAVYTVTHHTRKNCFKSNLNERY